MTVRGSKPLPSVLRYEDYRAYLRDWFAAKKARDPGFSHTVFARKAGLASRGHSRNVAAGLANLTGISIGRFAAGLGLSQREKDYFRMLVAYNQAKDPSEREIRLGEIRWWVWETGLREVSGSYSRGLLSRWPRFLVFCITDMRGFRADPSWISRRLAPRVGRKEAEEALHFLRSSGLIRTKGTRLLGTMAGHTQFGDALDNSPRTRRIVTSLLRDAAGLQGRRPERFLSVHALLSDEEARAVARAVRETLVKAIPVRRRRRVPGRLYRLLWDAYPLST